jgi:hypothetical protein
MRLHLTFGRDRPKQTQKAGRIRLYETAAAGIGRAIKAFPP